MSQKKKRDIVQEILEVKNRRKYLASIYDVQAKVIELKSLYPLMLTIALSSTNTFQFHLLLVLKLDFAFLSKVSSIMESHIQIKLQSLSGISSLIIHLYHHFKAPKSQSVIWCPILFLSATSIKSITICQSFLALPMEKSFV